MAAQEKTKFRLWIEKIIPIDQIFPYCLVFLTDMVVYFLSKLITDPMSHRVVFMEVDNMIPLVPQMVWIYFLAFPYWLGSGIVAIRTGGIERYRYVTEYMLALLIALVSFSFIRLEITRPDIEVTGPSTAVLNWLYQTDSPTNLFPSLHCVFSYFAFIGLLRKTNVRAYWKVLSFIFMILIFASTVMLKQHYFLDLVSGILIAMLSDLICQNTNLYKIVFKLSKKFYGLFKIELDDNGNEVSR